MINSWSFSSLQVFEKCPYWAYLKYVERIPEPENKYSTRGSNIHSAAEAYIKSETPALAQELSHFSIELAAVRELYNSGKVMVEQEWAHTNEWNVTNWRSQDAWLRLKLDMFIFLDKTTGLVIDLKSGKKFGNEIKHAEQGQLYTGVAFMRQPELKKIITEFWYTDQNDLTRVDYTPQQAAKFLGGFDRRAKRMTEAKNFQPRPSIFSCKWCPYRPESVGGNGHCKFGVGHIEVSKKQFR